MRRLLVGALLMHCDVTSPPAAQTEIQWLSGTGPDDTIDWEFKVNGGRNSGRWSTIPVPSNWEMQGFGEYHYWKDWGDQITPDSTAYYRRSFTVPPEWNGYSTRIVFGAVMTDATVKINGTVAGPTHRGGFYQFEYDVSGLLNFGKTNLIEVEVGKFSANQSVNEAEREADYWLFGGIYRPVWLESKPEQHIEHVAIDARHEGDLEVHVDLRGVRRADQLAVQLLEVTGEKVGSSLNIPIDTGQTRYVVRGKFDRIRAWSAESPHRYRLEISLLEQARPAHRVRELFGFRTVEVKQKEGFYVNGKKTLLKGVNRHSIWPTTGRATSSDQSLKDVRLIKEMNMNAVRMSHYPPDSHFLHAADRLGLYVIDELGGWQKPYDTETGEKLVAEMVSRDVSGQNGTYPHR